MVPACQLEAVDSSAPRVDLQIPAAPGSYVLVLAAPQSLRLEVGRLGWVTLTPGYYVYFGSAMGPGGLRARLGRHLRPDKTRRWHIDYLTQHTWPVAVHWRLEPPGVGPVHLECLWCQQVVQHAGVTAPVRHFGSSDCRAGCPAHLLRLPTDLTITQLLGELI